MRFGNDPELLRKMAQNRLNICRKYEHESDKYYSDFILGKFTCALGQWNPAIGRYEQCTWAVMETIYDDYRAHPELKINERLQEVLNEAVANEPGGMFLENAIDCLLYQMRSEKQNTAPFTLDIGALLDALRENIREHRADLYERDMMEALENYDQTLREHYGVSIL